MPNRIKVIRDQVPSYIRWREGDEYEADPCVWNSYRAALMNYLAALHDLENDLKQVQKPVISENEFVGDCGYPENHLVKLRAQNPEAAAIFEKSLMESIKNDRIN